MSLRADTCTSKADEFNEAAAVHLAVLRGCNHIAARAATRSSAADRCADGLRGGRRGGAAPCQGVLLGAPGLWLVDGQNVQFEYRWPDGDIKQIRALAKELVGLRPNVLVAAG